jgi:hypothetical protein
MTRTMGFLVVVITWLTNYNLAYASTIYVCVNNHFNNTLYISLRSRYNTSNFTLLPHTRHREGGDSSGILCANNQPLIPSACPNRQPQTKYRCN